MKPIAREEIVDYATYGDRRAEIRPNALAAKALRRVIVADVLTFLFENRETVRYQIQEMMRVERIVRESEIQHEIDTYNELIHPPGTLGCTLLIGIEDEAERDVLLRKWLKLNERLYAELADGSRIRPTYDPRQVGTDRLSSVQYLTFEIGPDAPVAIGADHDELTGATVLSDAQRGALGSDLNEA